ncbi:molybdopterin-binding protein [Acetobacterium wieringae]|uniref:molybdopterin-binding protein n=1 Tax=Acetobacterium wieringae TaxID=52694 RepID=UPI002B1FA20A|nr:molybdopterin-binding protein [Acetobacterium wieringae]MEA4807254.1 molybdopterin-binding protein [Acetobacterium wieringae]
MLHENEAASILANACSSEFAFTTEPKEGKIEIIAVIDGLLKIDVERLNRVNTIGEMMIATRHTNFAVKKGDVLAGTRIIPLVIRQEKMDKVVEIFDNRSFIEIKPFKEKTAGIIITGNEVFNKRVKDEFGPVIRRKLEDYPVQIVSQQILGDDPEAIKQAILDNVSMGVDMAFCTGGMSVDPDDTTPTTIIKTGARMISYGAPVLPVAMFLLAYYNEKIPIIGLLGCVMYSKRTIFDLMLPRLIADDKIESKNLECLGHGGLCLNCEICTFPNCGFGKSDHFREMKVK